MDDTNGVSKINSCQNRLLKSDAYKQFNQCRLSINLDASFSFAISC